MAGIDNDVNFGLGYRLEATPSTKYPLMQKAATDVGQYNNAGTPEGVISANPGSLCHDRTNGVIYYKNTGTGNTGWVLIPSGSAVGLTITGNSGGPLNPLLGNWNLVGSGSLTTSGSGNTLTSSLTGLTNHAVLVGAGTDTITKVGPVASTGSVLMSNGVSSDPGFSTATYPLTTTINQLLYSSAANVVSGLATANDSILVTNGSGVPAWTAKSAFGQTITGNSGGPIAPSAGNWNVIGSGSFTISGSGSTLTGALTGLTNHAVLVGAGTDTITKVGPTATAGQILQSAGSSADPAFSTATYPATTTINQLLYSSAANVVSGLATANNGVLITSATGVPSLLANGTTGQILTATTGSPPSWADNTAGGGLLSASGTLTNSQIKNLRATPITLIAAPGSGKVLFVVSAVLKLNYGGTNVFTASAGVNVSLRYSGVSLDVITGTSGQWFANGTIGASANRLAMYPGSFLNTTPDSAVNVGLVAINTGGSEIAGNAANDNTMSWNILYYILTI